MCGVSTLGVVWSVLEHKGTQLKAKYNFCIDALILQHSRVYLIPCPPEWTTKNVCDMSKDKI